MSNEFLSGYQFEDAWPEIVWTSSQGSMVTASPPPPPSIEITTELPPSSSFGPNSRAASQPTQGADREEMRVQHSVIITAEAGLHRGARGRVWGVGVGFACPTSSEPDKESRLPLPAVTKPPEWGERFTRASRRSASFLHGFLMTRRSSTAFSFKACTSSELHGSEICVLTSGKRGKKSEGDSSLGSEVLCVSYEGFIIQMIWNPYIRPPPITLDDAFCAGLAATRAGGEARNRV